MDDHRTIRREFLRSLSVAGLGALAGCGSGDEATAAQPTQTPTDPSPTHTPTEEPTDTPSATSDTDEERVDPDVVAGIEQHAIPIRAVDPDESTGSLSDVATALADASIVGMGEATHGTWEFQAVRHRLVRTLIVEHGLKAVAFEDNFGGLRPVDEYVRHGQGDLDAAMDAFGDYMFRTAEVRRLLRWLRSYNDGRPAEERVGVYGTDMQIASHAAKRVRAYLQQVDQAYLESINERLTEAVKSSDRHYDEAEVELLLDVATDVQSRLTDHRAAYVEASSQSAWELARRNARAIEQSGLWGDATLEGDTAKEMVLAGFEVRDRMMAENTTWIAEYVDGPVALWAHNSHVTRGRRAEGPDGEPPPSQGEFLARTHGSDYYPLVLTFGTGSFTARLQSGTLGHGEVDEPADGTAAEVCVEVEHPQFFVDFDAATTNPDVGTWLGGTHGLHNVGLLWGGSVDVNEFRPREDADGLLFIRETTPTEPIGADASRIYPSDRWSRAVHSVRPD